MELAPVTANLKLSATPTARRRSPAASESFRRTLEQARPVDALQSLAKRLHTVRSGETLSGICRDELLRLGLSATRSAIYDAVEKVAEANGLDDPDLILAGQELDLSALAPAAGGPVTASLPGAPLEMSTAALISGAARVAELARRSSELTGAVSSLLNAAVPITSRPQEPAAGPPPGLLSAPARISSGFGLRKDPFSGKLRRHDGVDLAAPAGTTIYPLRAGVVTFSGSQRGYGKMVVVRHADGLETVYAHNSKNAVKRGQLVTASTPLGEVGETGRATGPHLHFEARRAGRAINPMPLLSDGSVEVAQVF